MSPSCLFCAIATGTAPAAIVLEDPGFLAFLDHRPLFPGHCLLIPRAHHATLPDLPAGETGPLFERARLLCRAVETAMDAAGSLVALNNRVSQSVPHLHVHIVPRRPKDGLKGFFWPRGKYAGEQEMLAVRDAIRRALA